MNSELRQSPEFQELLHRFGSLIQDLGGEQAANVLRLPILPVVSWMVIQGPWDPAILTLVDELARRYRAIFVKVAPRAILGSPQASAWEEALKAHGYRLDKEAIVPTKTIVVDLGMDEADLLAQMKSKTRYNIRLAQRRGGQVRVLDGKAIGSSPEYFEAFYKVFRQNNKRLKMPTGSRKLFRTMFEVFGENIFVAYVYSEAGELGAAATFMVAGDTVWYQMNGATEEGRREFAANLAVWEGMREAKRRGCRWLDFDGVYDDRYPDTEVWKGFSRFKAGFGGEEVSYLGSYVKWWSFLKRMKAAR